LFAGAPRGHCRSRRDAFHSRRAASNCSEAHCGRSGVGGTCLTLNLTVYLPFTINRESDTVEIKQNFKANIPIDHRQSSIYQTLIT